MKNSASPAAAISASLNISKKHRKSLVPAVTALLLAVISCLGSVFSFLSCFDLPVKIFPVIISAAAVCTVFTFTLRMKKQLRGIASISASAIFIILTYIFRNSICAGLANVLNIYLARIKKEFRNGPFIFISDTENAGYFTTVFLCFFTAFICLAAVYFISKEWYAVGLCIPPLILPIALMMFGLEPDHTAFSAVVAGCAASIALENGCAESLSASTHKYAASCSGLAAAAAAFICFSVISAAVGVSDYERPQKLNDIYNSVTGYIESGGIQNVIDNVVTIVTRDTGRTGAINHGKLGEFDEIYFDGRPVLRITMPKPDETVYLRGFVGADYTGNSWKELSGSAKNELKSITENFSVDGLSTMLFDGFSLKYAGVSIPKYSFSVKNISAGRDYLYMPYDLVPESVSHYASETGGGFSGGETSYFGQFYDPSEYYGYQRIFRMRWNISGTMNADEAAYRNFVYENYLELPSETERLDSIFGNEYLRYISSEETMTGKSTLDEMTVFSRKLYYIKSWLRNNCEYSLKAGKLPAGRDFIDYFLDTKKGSCSHFASTAVMMCRYAGIPARYVEGYIIKPSSDFPAGVETGETATIDITDSRAHSWAEIYIDGFGWYPMEFTSGYGNVRTAVPTETTPPETVSETETETETEETTVVSDTEAESEIAQTTVTARESSAQQPAETTAPQSTAFRDESEISAPTEEENSPPTVGFGIFGIKGKGKSDIFYDLTDEFFILLGILAVPAAFIIRRRICLLLYRRKCAHGGKTAVLAAYKKFLRIAGMLKLPKQGDMGSMEYARKLSEGSPLLSDGTAETVIGTALKASFGGRQLTSEDAHNAVLAVGSLSKSYSASLSAWKRFTAKYIYCII